MDSGFYGLERPPAWAIMTAREHVYSSPFVQHKQEWLHFYLSVRIDYKQEWLQFYLSLSENQKQDNYTSTAYSRNSL